MIVAAVTLAVLALIVAHAAILAQFIGTTDGVLATLALVQGLSLLAATVLLASKYLASRRARLASVGAQPVPRSRLPGWLIFSCVLLVATVLLGEISILIARIEGDTLSYLQHVPTLTVFAVCAIVCVAWSLKPVASRTVVKDD